MKMTAGTSQRNGQVVNLDESLKFGIVPISFSILFVLNSYPNCNQSDALKTVKIGESLSFRVCVRIRVWVGYFRFVHSKGGFFFFKFYSWIKLVSTIARSGAGFCL